MSRVLKLAILAVFFNFFVLSEAQAVCSTPAGEAGQVLFQTPDFLFCDGTNWLNLTSNTFETLNLGNGTTSLQVGISTPAGAGSYSLVLPTSDGNANQFLQTDGAGVLTWASVSGDNLGNHTATQNIVLGSYWLSGDGGNEGIKVDASGNVTLDGQANRSLGVATAFAPATAGGDLTVKAGDGISGTSNSDGGNLILSSGGITGNQGSAINFMYGPSSGVSGSTFRAPVLGMTLSANGYLGINDISPSYRFAVKDDQSGQATTMISQNANGNGLEPAMRIVRGKTSATGNALSTTGVSVDFSSYSETFSSFADFGKLIYGWEVDQTNGTTDRDSYYSIHTMQDNALSEKVRVSSAGNLGVGTSAPARKLHVAGPIRLNATTTPASPAAGDIFIDSAASNALKYYNGTSWVSLTGGGTPAGADTQLQFNNAGAFGADSNLNWDNTNKRLAIGLTGPSNRLMVRDTSNPIRAEANWSANTVGNALLLDTANAGAAGGTGLGTGLTMRAETTTTYPRDMSSINSFWTDGTDATRSAAITFNTVNSGAALAERMRIAADGNVGIGTNSPTRPLHVNGPMRLTASTTPGSPVAGDIFIDSAASNALKYYNGSAWVSLTGGGTPAGANTQIQFNNAGAFGANANLVWDNTNSRLGVGTAAPPYRFTVRSPAVSTTAFAVQNSSGNDIFEIYEQASGSSQFVLRDSAGTQRVRLNSTGDNFFNIANNVGIGTATPSTKLDVTGSIRTAPISIAAGTTTLDLSQSNYFQVAFTGNLCTGLTLNNMVEGTTYTIATNGVTGGTCSFSSAGLIFSYAPQNAAVTSDALYTMMKVGSKVYVSWINQFDVPATTGVASVTASPPLSSSGGTNPDISISQASSTTNGYLSSADWNTFNNKMSLSCAANEVPFYNGSAWICKSATPNKTASTVVYRDASADIAASTITMDDMLVGNGTTALQVALNTPAGAGSYSLTLPTTDGNSGEVLTTNGTGVLSWTAPSGGGTPGGADTQLQFNDGGAFNGDTGLTWNKTNKALTLTSSNANAFTVGRAGATNPAFKVNASAATSATGLEVTARAAGGGVELNPLSSGANEAFTINSKGTGKITVAGQGNVSLTSNISSIEMNMSTNTFEVWRSASASNTTSPMFHIWQYSGSAPAAESNMVRFDMQATRTHSAGSYALQRDFRVIPATHGASAASTITNAASVAIDGAPIAGSNMTLTNSSALYIPTVNVDPGTGAVTNSYGLNVAAATGATNNYAAAFTGGNVGVGTASPARLLQVEGPMRLTASTTPASPVAGDIFIDSAASNALKYYNGSGWVSLTGGGSGDFMADGSVPMTGQFKAANGSLASPSISFSVDPDTGFYSSGTNRMSLVTGGSQMAAFDGGFSDFYKHVRFGTGMGWTTTNAVSLHSTPLYFQNATTGQLSSGDGTVLSLSGSDFSINNREAAGLLFSANGAERMRIDSAGNVGIRTASPATPLHVLSPTVTNSTFESAAGNNAVWLELKNGFSTGSGEIIGTTIDNMNFYTQGLERVRIDSAGNVGIGTTSPARLLHVEGPMRLTASTTPATPVAGDIFIDSAASNALKYYNGSAWVTLAGGGSGDFMANGSVPMTGQLRAADGTAAAPSHSFANGTTSGYYRHSSGYTAISHAGTDQLLFNGSFVRVPSTPFTVGSSNTGPRKMNVIGQGGTYVTSSGVWNTPVQSATEAAMMIENVSAGDNNGALIEFKPWNLFSNQQRAYIGAVSASGAANYTPSIVFGQQTGAASFSEKMRIDTTGNIGINTSSPRSELDVNGTILMKPAVLDTTSPIDFSTGNLQYTTGNCGAFAMWNVKDGGSYTFAVQGTTSATCSFTIYDGAGTSQIAAGNIHMPTDHGATTASKHTLYTILRMGAHVYVSWMPGL